MTTHTVHWSGSLVAAVLVAGAATLAGSEGTVAQTNLSPQTVQQPGTGPHGSTLYRTYCASCHGETARGDGPLAASMRRKPLNLTEIAKRNGGVYPRDLVFKIIDGRQKVSGHGGPDMPVWGDAFRRSVEVGDETAVAARIQALVDYLELMQARNSQ
jgi:mono/diheme cytochrome c family protein